MTTEEFNKKYEKYLGVGHYGLAINDPDVIDYLDGVFQIIIKTVPNFQFYQIKLKFSAARFYTNLNDILVENKEIDLENIIENNIERILAKKKTVVPQESIAKLQKYINLYVFTINKIDDLFEYRFKSYAPDDLKKEIYLYLDHLAKSLKEI